MKLGLFEVKGILMLFEWFISPDVMLTLQDLLLNTNGCISRVKNTIFETIVFIHLQPHLSCLSPDHRLHAGLLTLKVLWSFFSPSFLLSRVSFWALCSNLVINSRKLSQIHTPGFTFSSDCIF